MRIITEKDEMRRFSRGQRAEGKRVAFVPTMGYLHEGHLSLVRAARERADVVVTSIYINPTQFAAHEDFDVYPRLLDTDRKKLQDLGCDVCYEPPSLYVQGTPGAGDNSVVVGAEEHMPGAHETFIQVEQLQRPLCGHSRPHFFRGVATIVAKLFNIVQPNIAVFGKKDYQQWRIIRRMVRDLDFEVEVLGMPISREPDGLAMSSRNARLTAASRSQAAAIPQALSWAAEQVREHSVPSADELTAEVARRIRESGGQVDYVSLVDREELRSVAQVQPGMCLLAVAVFFPANDRGTVRLLDNVEL